MYSTAGPNKGVSTNTLRLQLRSFTTTRPLGALWSSCRSRKASEWLPGQDGSSPECRRYETIKSFSSNPCSLPGFLPLQDASLAQKAAVLSSVNKIQRGRLMFGAPTCRKWSLSDPSHVRPVAAQRTCMVTCSTRWRWVEPVTAVSPKSLWPAVVPGLVWRC